MKKRDLAGLALIGISVALACPSCDKTGKPKPPQIEANDQFNSDMKAFYNSLSPETQKKFMELDAQHRMMAIEMANQKCSGKNACAGMGGCSTQDHTCAARNDCKGQGGPPIKNANKAVDIQYQMQKEQRQSMNGKMLNGKKSPNQNGKP